MLLFAGGRRRWEMLLAHSPGHNSDCYFYDKAADRQSLDRHGAVSRNGGCLHLRDGHHHEEGVLVWLARAFEVAQRH